MFIISDYREKDGYTLEEIDIYGVQDGKEVIVHHKVRSACCLFKVCVTDPLPSIGFCKSFLFSSKPDINLP